MLKTLNSDFLDWEESLGASDYENKESRETNDHTKRQNWSSFKEAPYRNPDMSQQL